MSKASELLKLLEKYDDKKYQEFCKAVAKDLKGDKVDVDISIAKNLLRDKDLETYIIKELNDLKSFVDYLNKNKFEFLGIDNI
jgi:hypothetical protein